MSMGACLKAFTTARSTKRRAGSGCFRRAIVVCSCGLNLKVCDFIEAVLVDGSFVTGTPEPNDIDLVLVVASNYDLSADLPPVAYNLLAHHRVRRRFGFDIVVVKNDSANFEQAVAFFQQVKQRPDLKKGILRIKL
jgi:hypothetical protein